MRAFVWVALALVVTLVAASAAQAEKRIAFVVGIDKYDNLGPQQQLQRAVNDARAVGAALGSVGFEVTSAENVGRGAFNAIWQQFIDMLQPDDTAAIYFSGHGVEIEGSNFLLPRDVPSVNFGRQEQLKRESLSVSEMLLDLRRRKPQVTLVILDACRDNPLVPPEQRSLSWGKGLARMDAPAGTFIMYSAGAGETALDRLPGNDPDKVNSIYTRRLLPLVKTPNLPLHELARKIRSEVHALAATVQHVQQPAYYDGLIGKFCLAGCNASGSVPPPKTALSSPGIKPSSVPPSARPPSVPAYPSTLTEDATLVPPEIVHAEDEWTDNDIKTVMAGNDSRHYLLFCNINSAGCVTPEPSKNYLLFNKNTRWKMPGATDFITLQFVQDWTVTYKQGENIGLVPEQGGGPKELGIYVLEEGYGRATVTADGPIIYGTGLNADDRANAWKHFFMLMLETCSHQQGMDACMLKVAKRCQPGANFCTMNVDANLVGIGGIQEPRKVIVMMATDTSNKQPLQFLSRIVCTYPAKDARVCREWDTGLRVNAGAK
jgi:Caspase domain